MELVLYADGACVTCERSRTLVQDVAVLYPDLKVHIVESSQTVAFPADVIAVPTFKLQGRVISIGNPTLKELIASIREAEREENA